MALEQVGVEAVVEGVAAFKGQVGQLNSILGSLRPQATLIQRAFSSLGEGMIGFANQVWSVFKVTLGVLIRDAINAVITKIKDLIAATVEAGSQFQILELRLERLNFNDLIESTDDYNAAAQEAIRLTQEQLAWIIRLASQTPYDAEDVANTFTLARAYGFTSDEARNLTQDILDFAAGMGLSNQQMERVIINFGQLRSQGKLNMMELRDLARGAFVPINDVLERMKRNMGLTNEEFDRMRRTGQLTGPAVEEFFKAFQEMVDENFAGAAQRMALTAAAAKGNLIDMVKGLGGMVVVKPILDVIGEKLAGFINLFTQDDTKWNRLTGVLSRIGGQLSGIISDIFSAFGPGGGEGVADGLIGGLEGIATWLGAHHSEIVLFFKGIGDTIKNDVIPFVQDKLLPAISKFGDWVDDHKDEILGFFEDVGDTIRDDVVPFIRDQLLPAIGELFKDDKKGESPIGKLFDTLATLGKTIAENLPKAIPVIKSIVDVITKLVSWIANNPDTVKTIFKFIVAFQIMATVGSILVGVLISLLSAIPTLIALFLGFGVAIQIAWGLLWVWLAEKATEGWNIVIGIWAGMVANALLNLVALKDGAVAKFEELKNLVVAVFNGIKNFIMGGKESGGPDWKKTGNSIIDGIKEGVINAASGLLSAVVNAVQNAYNAAANWLLSHSPSKRFFQLGEFTMEGMAQGILGTAHLAANAMTSAMQQMTIPAIQMQAAVAARPTVSSVSNSTRNYNLTVNTNAPVEPILQDFNMMQSLASG